MQYGYFDNENQEYVITDSRTPAPWANYLGSPEFGAIISNNAGGYSFVKSGANGRILRYFFNGSDTPGRYVYLRDNTTGAVRLLTRHPDLCRHGMGYTEMETATGPVRSEILFYIPEGKSYEVWNVRLHNGADHPVSVTLTGYAEFTSNSNYEQDGVNLQYSQFITKTYFKKNRIRQLIHANLENSSSERLHDLEERFFALCGKEVTSFCGDREEFLGAWGTYENPKGVMEGTLSGAMNYGGNACGALAASFEMGPGETVSVAYILSAEKDDAADKICKKYRDSYNTCEKEITEIRKARREKIGHFKVKTPSWEFDTMVNTWNAYNSFITFTWSRAASFFYCGLRNGYGYRDTVQDIQGILHLDPEAAREKLTFMLSAQASNGGGLPLVEFDHCPGKEGTPDDEKYRKETGHPAWRADDALWLFPTVYKYICETGDLSYLDEIVPFSDKGEDTVYDHLKRAINFSHERTGKHGMPAGLYADWNDCLRLGAQGESTFVALQYYYALRIIRELAEYKKDTSYLAFLKKETEKFSEILEKNCFEKDRYIRGYTEEGDTIGSEASPEAKFWLNPQSWAVISGAADAERGKIVLDNVYKKLNCDYGAMLMMPPFKDKAFKGALAVIYNAGMKENSAVFAQTQGWLILAEALLGRGERAFSYYMENCPAAQNSKADIRVMEPYVYGQFTEGKMSPHAGRAHVHWLTGTASTMMVASVEGILGIRPDLYGLALKPAIPSFWDEFEIQKDFRGKHLHIVVKNPGHRESGFRKMLVDGKEMESPYIPENSMRKNTEIELYIS